MKASVWGYWLIALGIFVLVIMMLLQSYTTTDTQDYYLVKEVTYAALHDAVDLSHYRATGELKINREKFVENFVRRFAESITMAANEYKIDFFELYETPPKVSVRVATKSATYNVAGDSSSFNVVNTIDAILELPPKV
jgi:hypothetical protein